MSLVEMLNYLQEPWALRALVASGLVGIMCGMLGCFIVLRNMALIGDALSHAILPGVVVAFLLLGQSTLGFFGGAVVAGLLSAVAITWIQRNVKTRNDAAIGIVFTSMFALGVIGISRLSRLPGVHLDLKDFLFGNVLGVSNDDLYLTASITVYVLLSIVIFYRYLFMTTFQPVIAQTMGVSVKVVHYYLMLLLSFAVVAALQTVGVILVVAMLITPAATALLLSKRLPTVLLLAALLGLASAVAGLMVAIVLEIAPGPAMAVMATLFYLAAALFAPGKGLVFRYLQQRALQRRIRIEDTLKQSFHLQNTGKLTLKNLAMNLGFSSSVLNGQLMLLRQKGLMEKDLLHLTDAGNEEARRLVRAHRLWETYLASEVGLSAEQIHDPAEQYEHLLSDEILDEVDRTLGYPSIDPHGSPIPARRGLPTFSLFYLEPGQEGIISKKQGSEQIASRLWHIGLAPKSPVLAVGKKEEGIEVQQNGLTILVPQELARRVSLEVAPVLPTPQ